MKLPHVQLPFIAVIALMIAILSLEVVHSLQLNRLEVNVGYLANNVQSAEIKAAVMAKVDPTPEPTPEATPVSKKSGSSKAASVSAVKE